MSKPLFEIREEHLDTGLRGFPVGYCTTSHVDPQKGLFYRNQPVAELAFWPEEKVIYLLYYGKEPSAAELISFKEQLQNRCTLPVDVIKQIGKLPKKGSAMALFSIAIQLLGIEILTNDWEEDALNLIAKIPALAACVINHHGGFGKGAKSSPKRGYCDNFMHMLGIEHSKQLLEVLKLFFILHFDHGGGNLSTFVGKAVASSLADLFGSLASAMNALAGPKHGLANQECLHFVQQMIDELGEYAKESDLEKLIRKKLSNNELIYGFGHAVLRVEDPRATVFYELAEREYKDNPLIKMALMLRKVGSLVLRENPKIADPYTNIDAISGSILMAAGFYYPEYYTLLFGASRCVGIAIQIVYERLYARGGKGTPIVRPKYIYKSSS